MHSAQCFEYRFGFNGKEQDNEVSGQGNSYAFKHRIYDSRLGRFFSVDPLTKSYPFYTPYQFAANTPIQAIDLEGLQGYKIVDHQSRTTSIIVDFLYVSNPKGNPTVKSNAQVNILIASIMTEFHLGGDLYDKNNQDEFGNDYKVNLVINPVELPNRRELNKKLYSSLPIGVKGDINGQMVLEQNAAIPQRTVTLADGSVVQFQVAGYSKQNYLSFSDEKNGHTGLHELWHNLVHNHYNSPSSLRNQIGSPNQEPGHAAAGGIFIYENPVTGATTQPINQKNIDDALGHIGGYEIGERKTIDQEVNENKGLILGSEGM